MRFLKFSQNRRSIRQPVARWIFAVGVVFLFAIFSTGVSSSWISAATSGISALSGVVSTPEVSVSCGDESQQIGFLSASGDPLDSVNLDNPGDSVEIQVCADGLTLGGLDTAQIVIEHDDSVVELINPACAGLLDGGFVSPSTKRTSDDQASAFICTKPGGVSGSNGALISLTARRVGVGTEVFVFRTSGILSTGFYESGLPVSVVGFDSLSIQETNPAATAVPTMVPVSAPAPFIPLPTPTLAPTAVPSGGGSAPLRFEPPSEPSSFVVTAGVGSIVLTWGVPDDTSGRPID